jgi:presenilin-like A22 family membrane protease
LKPKNPNRTQTEKNMSQTGLFEPVSIFLKFSLITFFFDKKRIEQKMITPGIISSNIYTFLTHESLNLDIFNVISLELSYLTKLHFVGFLK